MDLCVNLLEVDVVSMAFIVGAFLIFGCVGGFYAGIRYMERRWAGTLGLNSPSESQPLSGQVVEAAVCSP